MKIASLLAQYLYNTKRLDLPGLGTFLFDPAAVIEPENSKHKSAPIQGISFESNTAVRESPELISFISSQTGKMKALAQADLGSHLELAQQFLNIGKPFLFEGIGTLVKMKPGQFSFTSGEMIPGKKEHSAKENASRAKNDESFEGYKNIQVAEPKAKWKKPAIILLLIVGAFVAVWGGYTVYKKTTAKNHSNDITTETPKEDKQEIVRVQPADTIKYQKPDSAATPLQKDTTVVTPPPVAPVLSAGMSSYKFVVEVANKDRALLRFDKLKNFGLDIHMETKDSVSFKLFFLIPALASDTTRIKDSLSIYYTPAWTKAHVETSDRHN